MDAGMLEQLFSLYYRGEATDEQKAALMEALRDAEPELLGQLIQREGEALEEVSPVTTPAEAGAMLQHILAEPPVFRRLRWARYAAAAAILMLLATGLIWVFGGKQAAPQTAVAPVDTRKVLPAREKAMLLVDGSDAITLDTLHDGPVAGTPGAVVSHRNGQLVYANTSLPVSAQPTYNTVITGKGNFYRLTLSDGTKVWLNASTSLRFPVTFTGRERRVEVAGEAYFEVAKDAARPFRVVAAGRSTVEVLGTHFNVNAYPEEPVIKTTLLEGAVKVSAGSSESRLQPGQQAVLDRQQEIRIRQVADAGQAVAWKDGYFWFENTGLRELMNEAARWYDVEVQYEGRLTEEGFSGKLPRDVPLSRLLKVLDLYGVSARLEGKRLIIFQ